mgnify:CR=1 FL=1
MTLQKNRFHKLVKLKIPNIPKIFGIFIQIL